MLWQLIPYLPSRIEKSNLPRFIKSLLKIETLFSDMNTYLLVDILSILDHNALVFNFNHNTIWSVHTFS